MSGPFSQPGSAPGSAAGGTPPAGFGQAMGNQAQMGQLLQLLTQMLAALQGNIPGANFYQVYPVTAAGNLDIAATYPNATAGIFSIRQTVAAPIQVTLPATGGPWGIADGAGVAGTGNITIIGAGGNTILGNPSFVMNSNWESATFVLDGSNFIIL